MTNRRFSDRTPGAGERGGGCGDPIKFVRGRNKSFLGLKLAAMAWFFLGKNILAGTV